MNVRPYFRQLYFLYSYIFCKVQVNISKTSPCAKVNRVKIVNLPLLPPSPLKKKFWHIFCSELLTLRGREVHLLYLFAVLLSLHMLHTLLHICYICYTHMLHICYICYRLNNVYSTRITLTANINYPNINTLYKII